MQSLLNSSIILILVLFTALILLDLIASLKNFWSTCTPKPQSTPTAQMQRDVWESTVEPVKRKMVAAPIIHQLCLPMAKEKAIASVELIPAKRRGRPKKTVVTLPTSEATLATTFCQPSQVQPPAKKRSKSKK